jgi:hypothetical protein
MASDLIAVIKQKQEAIAKLQAELAEARALLVGEPRPKSRMQASPEVVEKATSRRVRRRRRGRMRLRRPLGVKAAKGEIVPTSSVGLTVAVLKRAGRPLHINDIIKEIEREGHTVKKITLVGNLSRYITRNRVFYRLSPSVYGLLEMKRT